MYVLRMSIEIFYMIRYLEFESHSKKVFFDFYLFSSTLTLANDVVTNTVKEVGKQFQQAFMVEDTKKEVIAKVLALENRVNGKC